MILSVLLLSWIFPLFAASAADLDLIQNLRGTSNINVPFKQYSGYLRVLGTKGDTSKYIHYWFVQSKNNPSTDPVTFWTNGGPGCSGLLGFLSEEGPFVLNWDGTISLNEHSWNAISNMVYLEAPVSVGFSYSTVNSDQTATDNSTVTDIYAAIQAFFVKFPDFMINPMYLASEGYGGHIVPMLSHMIVEKNDANPSTALNFKGFLVGNPLTTPYSGIPAEIDGYWGQQLISSLLYEEYTVKCSEFISTGKPETDCTPLLNRISDIVSPFYPCPTDSSLRRRRLEGRVRGSRQLVEYPECDADQASVWLNEVKSEIHVETNLDWKPCTSLYLPSKTDPYQSMVDHYKALLAKNLGLSILVYSWDSQAINPTIGTQSWIWNLGFTPFDNHWQFYKVLNQTAGFYAGWQDANLGFLTLHGAANEDPEYRYQVSLNMFANYIQGTWNEVLA